MFKVGLRYYSNVLQVYYQAFSCLKINNGENDFMISNSNMSFSPQVYSRLQVWKNSMDSNQVNVHIAHQRFLCLLDIWDNWTLAATELKCPNKCLEHALESDNQPKYIYSNSESKDLNKFLNSLYCKNWWIIYQYHIYELESV